MESNIQNPTHIEDEAYIAKSESATAENEVDFIAEVQQKTEDEVWLQENQESVLVDFSLENSFKEITEKGTFETSDLESILQREEELIGAVEYLTEENGRLNKINANKDLKLANCVELITSQRNWVHSLLDNLVKAQDNIESLEKTTNLMKEEYQKSQAENASLAEDLGAVQQEVKQLRASNGESDNQIKKANGIIKQVQAQKISLLEKVDVYENKQKRDRFYVGVLAFAAFIFLSFSVVAFLQPNASVVKIKNHESLEEYSKNDSKPNLSGIASLTTPLKNDQPQADSNSLVSNHNEIVGAEETSIKDGTGIESVVTQGNDIVLDDSIIENMLKAEGIKVSNTETPSRSSQSNSTLEEPQQKTQFYTVQANDNLWSISKKFYGSAKYIEKIKKENNLGKNLRVGTKLVISYLEEEQ